ncbi:hypothetical protein F0562_026544 [Nyssa sinensis]|uniref:Alpha/beta hydrolase fold-3 domain-containing protein n=1 Tax=Nyssa sinensis TaxID=561372 RepID=A0A5J5BD82_9ASTE|nr:hypothetical protein F0562_026544 [Nyssa sinensis]
MGEGSSFAVRPQLYSMTFAPSSPPESPPLLSPSSAALLRNIGCLQRGNIAYHAGLRAAATVDDLEPLKLKGLILHHPFFGGTERTGSEMRLANDKVLPVRLSDLMWELGLPIGADRDHEDSNPTVGGGSQLCDRIGTLRWKVMVTGCNGDPLIDRQIELGKILEEKGVQVVGKFGEEIIMG